MNEKPLTKEELLKITELVERLAFTCDNVDYGRSFQDVIDIAGELLSELEDYEK